MLSPAQCPTCDGNPQNPQGDTMIQQEDFEQKDYEARICAVAEEYEEEIAEQLEYIGEFFEGFDSRFEVRKDRTASPDLPDEVVNTTDDQWGWSIFIDVLDFNVPVDVRYQLIEEKVHEGSGEGVGWAVKFTFHGMPCGQINPRNYSDDLWVDHRHLDAVDEYFWEVASYIDEPALNTILNSVIAKVERVKEDGKE